MILGLRTDQPVAELYLWDETNEFEFSWQADRQLARDLLAKLEDFLQEHSCEWSDITGLVVFSGPGSFTGLRIGCTVANSISYSLKLPIVGTQTEQWRHLGFERLVNGENDEIVLPNYGSEPHITQPKR